MEIIVVLIIGACGIFIITDAKKRNMSGAWSLLGFLFWAFGITDLHNRQETY